MDLLIGDDMSKLKISEDVGIKAGDMGTIIDDDYPEQPWMTLVKTDSGVQIFAGMMEEHQVVLICTRFIERLEDLKKQVLLRQTK